MTDLHVPDRPSWSCAGCGVPQWPCDDAKGELTATYDPVGLAMYGAERLAEAARDLPNATPEGLFTRFVAWTRRRMPEIPTLPAGTRLDLDPDDWQLGRGQHPDQPFTLVVSETRTELAHHYGNEWVWITGHAEDCAHDHPPCREALVRTATLPQPPEAVRADR